MAVALCEDNDFLEIGENVAALIQLNDNVDDFVNILYNYLSTIMRDNIWKKEKRSIFTRIKDLFMKKQELDNDLSLMRYNISKQVLEYINCANGSHDIIIQFKEHYYDPMDGYINVVLVILGGTDFEIRVEHTLEFSISQSLNDASMKALKLKISNAVIDKLHT